MTLEEARPLIEAALEYAGGTHTFEDIRQLVDEGRLVFWPGPHSAVITEIIQFPQKRTLNFFLAGGNLAELEAMYPALEQWGRDQGCADAMSTCRRGWERTFLVHREGWESKLVVLTKEL